MDYGLGAVFGCPAHDQRDLDFAIKYNLKVTPVVKPEGERSFEIKEKAFTGVGELNNSPTPVNAFSFISKDRSPSGLTTGVTFKLYFIAKSKSL
jgi:leucyl-tRNA synthetase